MGPPSLPKQAVTFHQAPPEGSILRPGADQPSVFHPKQTRKEEPSEVSYQSLARPPKKPIAPARATPQLKKQPSRKKIEKSQEPLSAEEIKAANHRALEEFEEEEAKKAVLLLPNTGDNSESSDDADDPP